MKKYLCLILLVVLFILRSGLSPVLAVPPGPTGTSIQQSLNPNLGGSASQPDVLQWKQAIDNTDGGGPTNLHSWQSADFTGTLFSIANSIIPISKNAGGGATGFLGNSIGYLITTPPASSGRYVRYLANSIRVPFSAQTAYAADPGIGYQRLEPILAVWTLSRNFAYVLFALIFMIIGFMIIFRVKIDPKTVASIQNALPKIFVALILITFSYAIVGFMIDIMYVLIGLSTNLFRGVIDSGRLADLQKQLVTESIFGVFGANNFWQVSTGASGAIGNIVAELIGKSNVVNGAIGQIIGISANALAWLIISVAILWALARTWFMLLGAYIQIIIGVITAPLFLMFEAIPGRSVFGTWLRMMLSNILVFPFVTLILLVGYALTSGYGANGAATLSNNGFVPPYLGGNDVNAITALIGLGIILTLPKAVNILQEVLKTPPFKYGMAWSEALAWSYGRTAKPWATDIENIATARGEFSRRYGLLSIEKSISDRINRVTGRTAPAQMQSYVESKGGGKGPSHILTDKQ